MRIAIGGDHAGFHAKEELVAYLKELGHEVRDMGAYAFDPDDDYPDPIVDLSEGRERALDAYRNRDF